MTRCFCALWRLLWAFACCWTVVPIALYDWRRAYPLRSP